MMIHDIKRLASSGCPQFETIGWIPAHKVDIKLLSYNINFSVQIDLDSGSHKTLEAWGRVSGPNRFVIKDFFTMETRREESHVLSKIDSSSVFASPVYGGVNTTDLRVLFPSSSVSP